MEVLFMLIYDHIHCWEVVIELDCDRHNKQDSSRASHLLINYQCGIAFRLSSCMHIGQCTILFDKHLLYGILRERTLCDDNII